LYAESFGLHYSVCMPKQKWIGCSKLWFTKCRIHICLWFLLRLIIHKLRNSGVCWKLRGTAWLYVESSGLHWSVCMSKQKCIGCSKLWFAKCRIHICLWFLLRLIIHKLRNAGVCWKLCGTAWLYVESCGLHWSVCMSKQKWIGCAQHWFAKCLIHICLCFALHLMSHELRSSGGCWWLCGSMIVFWELWPTLICT